MKGSVKLTRDETLSILASGDTAINLAGKYGVDISTIHNILRAAGPDISRTDGGYTASYYKYVIGEYKTFTEAFLSLQKYINNVPDVLED